MTEVNNNFAALIKRSRSGDKVAFGQIYEQYFAPLYRYIYLRVGDQTVAEDLTQNVFTNVYSSLPRLTNVSLAYFYAAARNAVTDHYRKHKPIVNSEEVLAELADTRPGLPDQVDQELTRQKLVQTLRKLPKDYQEVITLRFVEGYSGRDVAKIIGRTEVATRQLQVRALKALKDRLKNPL